MRDGSAVGVHPPPAGRRKLMELYELYGVWDAPCGHEKSVVTIIGPCIARACRNCGHRVEFMMRFGRPKTFDAYAPGGETAAYVGTISVQDVAAFTVGTVDDVRIADCDEDISRMDSPVIVNRLTNMLCDELYGDDGQEPAAAADFAGAWLGMECRHDSASCMMDHEMLLATCDDCGAGMRFLYAGGDMFDVSVGRSVDDSMECGRHGVDAVAGAVRRFAPTLFLPAYMADCMSDDPDRDARKTARLASVLVRGGLLRRVGVSDRNDESRRMIRKLSAAVCGRREFVRTAREMIADARSRGVRFERGGRAVNTRRVVEEFRLAWPFWFVGDGVEVRPYDPTGHVQYCVRCMFSTLDDPGGSPNVWENGCPECGYGGYLIGANGRDVAYRGPGRASD